MILLLIAENGMFEISVINGVDLCCFQKILNISIFIQKFSWGDSRQKVKNGIYWKALLTVEAKFYSSQKLWKEKQPTNK